MQVQTEIKSDVISSINTSRENCARAIGAKIAAFPKMYVQTKAQGALWQELGPLGVCWLRFRDHRVSTQ